MKAVSNQKGLIAAASMDHAGSLQKKKTLSKRKRTTVSELLEEFKSIVTGSPHGSDSGPAQILLDPEGVYPPLNRRSPQCWIALAL